MRSIYWFRRDLRLQENTALNLALRESQEVICLFVLDPTIIDNVNAGEARLSFLFSSLENLAWELEKYGSRLIIRQGEPLQELTKLMQESKSSTLYFNRDYSPFARKRDEKIERELHAQGYTVKTAKDLVIFEKAEIVAGSSTPYTVFTPYKRRWLESILIADLTDFETNYELLRCQSEDLRNLTSLKLPPSPVKQAWYLPASTSVALDRLAQWSGEKTGNGDESIARIEDYAEQRNYPDIGVTSRLSPFLRFGLISVRQCYRAAFNARERTTRIALRNSCDTWISELIWRDFYHQILWNFPQVSKRAFQKKYEAIVWSKNSVDLQTWKDGRTGYPIVDAGMRQLNRENWMHNRLRMITASFLTKHLLIDWREGEKCFWKMLVDGDKAANNGGWQWSASTGTDAQPYFRIFNPILQSEKFDPQGNFIRRYLPELEKVPTEYIHEPWKMSRTMQENLGCIIGKDYPKPIIEHTLARERTLAVFKMAGAKPVIQ
jgi:deoxyribodipyrimidine photo-lyase